MKSGSRIVAIWTVLAASMPAIAQEVTAGVYGVVQDQSGAVVPSATIRLRNLATGREHQTASDESGNFSITLIPIGVYDVSAESPGFKRAVVADVMLRVNENRRIVFNMEVGQVTEAVTVVATAVAVNTATGTTSQLLDGRDPAALAWPQRLALCAADARRRLRYAV